MHRPEDSLQGDENLRRVEHLLPMRLVDLLLVTAATFAAVYLLLAARWHPSWVQAAVTYSLLAAGLPLLRWLACRFERLRPLHTVGNFWLMPCVALGHLNLGPILDAANPRLLDAELARLDLRIFGEHPALWLGETVGPLLTELAMISYYSYFIGPLTLGVLLYLRGPKGAYAEYALGLTLFFLANYLLYTAVPAVGPRYYLAGMFDEPLQGLWLTSTLEGLMRTPVFDRDCFPSGHTGITLTVLAFAWRYQRRFFWLMLPVGTGLIAGTLIGRFHYGIDLICAVPMVATVVMLSAFATHAGRLGVPQRALRAFRSLART